MLTYSVDLYDLERISECLPVFRSFDEWGTQRTQQVCSDWRER